MCWTRRTVECIAQVKDLVFLKVSLVVGDAVDDPRKHGVVVTVWIERDHVLVSTLLTVLPLWRKAVQRRFQEPE